MIAGIFPAPVAPPASDGDRATPQVGPLIEGPIAIPLSLHGEGQDA